MDTVRGMVSRVGNSAGNMVYNSPRGIDYARSVHRTLTNQPHANYSIGDNVSGINDLTGNRLIPGLEDRLKSRIASNEDYYNKLAKLLGVSPQSVKSAHATIISAHEGDPMHDLHLANSGGKLFRSKRRKRIRASCPKSFRRVQRIYKNVEEQTPQLLKIQKK
jgi:hypothetical protein